MKTFKVWEQCTATNSYRVQANTEQEARELVINGKVEPQKTDYDDYEITEVYEIWAIVPEQDLENSD